MPTWCVSSLASTKPFRLTVAPLTVRDPVPCGLVTWNAQEVSQYNLYACKHSGCGNNHCTHSGDVSVQCSYSSSTIRLMGGGRNYGRVEIYEYRVWGTVCDDTRDMTDANVACRELGYTGASSLSRSPAYGQGTGHILRDHINCIGSETSLVNCPVTKNILPLTVGTPRTRG